jgi:hypothetical protein
VTERFVRKTSIQAQGRGSNTHIDNYFSLQIGDAGSHKPHSVVEPAHWAQIGRSEHNSECYTSRGDFANRVELGADIQGWAARRPCYAKSQEPRDLGRRSRARETAQVARYQYLLHILDKFVEPKVTFGSLSVHVLPSQSSAE